MNYKNIDKAKIQPFDGNDKREEDINELEYFSNDYRNCSLFGSVFYTFASGIISHIYKTKTLKNVKQ